VIRRAALAAASILLSLLPAALAASPAPPVSDQLAIRVVVDTVSPFVLRPGEPVLLTGSIVNDSDQTLAAVHLRTRAQTRPVVTRSGLAQALTSTDPLGGDPVQDIDLHADVAAHSSLPWSATMPPDTVGGSTHGLAVFLLGAEARGRLGDSGERTTVARTRLPMPFVAPDARFRPDRLAILWPLVETPRRGPSLAYLDDDLAHSLSASGRLSTLLGAGSTARPTTVTGRGVAAPAAPLPLTWVVDPALLQGAADLADGYRVVSGRGTRQGDGDAAASTWLQKATGVLKVAADDQRLLTLPYADPDLEALRRNGLGTDVGVAVRRGAEQVKDVLGVNAADEVVWPPGSRITPETLDLLATSKVSELLLSGDALPPTEAPNHTPGARAVVQSSAGAMPVLLSDPVLDAVLAAGVADPDPSGGLAADGEPPSVAALVQRFLAETAMISAELPSRSRDFVTAPPRRWNPLPDFVSRLVNRIGDVPWLDLTPLDDLRSGPVDELTRDGLSYPASLQRSELSSTYLTQPQVGVAALRGRLRDLRSVLGDQAATATLPYDLALLRSESSQWREQPTVGQRVRHATASSLIADSRRVRIASAGLITLASQRGTLPITLENELDYPVSVRLRLSTPSRARLTAPEGQLRTIEAHRKRTLQVDAKAFTAGVFTVKAQLVTPDGQPYGDPVQLRVRSTAYGAIAVLITTGGLVVLAVAIVVRLTRRILRARRRTPEPAA
jgi:hypothetical protein